MLVLMIRIGESFEVGNNVKVHINSIKGNQVRVAIDAPKKIAVHRSAVAARIRAENGGVIPGREAE